jgi:hypothetical protein
MACKGDAMKKKSVNAVTSKKVVQHYNNSMFTARHLGNYWGEYKHYSQKEVRLL